jgi:flagellar basal body-associated protein FliL
MRTSKQQAGFAVLELILLVVILAALVAGGLWVYRKNQASKQATSSSTQSPVAHNVSTAPAINSTDDLDTALTTLDQNDPAAASSSDQTQLDSQVSF